MLHALQTLKNSKMDKITADKMKGGTIDLLNIDKFIDNHVTKAESYNEIVIYNPTRKELKGLLINKTIWDAYPNIHQKAIETLRDAQNKIKAESGKELPVLMYDQKTNGLREVLL